VMLGLDAPDRGFWALWALGQVRQEVGWSPFGTLNGFVGLPAVAPREVPDRLR
jgi:hypothetical protein